MSSSHSRAWLRTATAYLAISTGWNFVLQHSASTSFSSSASSLFATGKVTAAPAVAEAFELSIPSRPSYIIVDNVSQKYPVTLMNKLFSSVPKREYALQNVNLSFGHVPAKSLLPSSYITKEKVESDHGVTLVVGRSASGKSTLLRLLANMELPTDGRVGINGHWLDDMNKYQHQTMGTLSGMPSWAKMGIPPPPTIDISDDQFCRVQPIILQAKPDFDDTLTISERMVQVGLDTIQLFHKEWKKCSKMKNDYTESDATMRNQLETLASDFASLFELSEEQCDSAPSELSPSGEYLFGMACGCMMSVAPSIAILGMKNDNNSIAYKIGEVQYPILLLDELFDTEHPITVEKCSNGIMNLIRSGAVVISATHRPGYFESIANRTVTLSGGKVLMDTKSLYTQ